MTSAISILGDTLQRHAYENVWCAPNQDKQVVLRLARLTPDNGVRNQHRVQWQAIALPTKVDRYHIYQIGQVYPPLLGLKSKLNQWVNVAQSCSDESCVVDLYSTRGVQLPRFKAWYRLTTDRNLIVAIQIPDFGKIDFDLDKEYLYMRLYTNAYFESIRADRAEDVVEVRGTVPKSTQEILDFQYALQQKQNLGYGHVYCFLNGMKVSNLTLLNVALGDYIEYVYDGSIRAVVQWDVADLLEFRSELDDVRKYLLHHTLDVESIDYQDDIDLFLVKKDGTSHKGIYYHKNNASALRMVTHRDYSVPTQYLMSYAQNVSQLGENVDELTLIAHIRNSGFIRPLVYENQRIQDLYKLEDKDIINAMVGINATVDVWKAENLENSGYCSLMRQKLGSITRKSVQEAYGYNAVSKILGDTPQRVRLENTQKVVDVPVGLQQNCTAYEYDAEGKLLGWHTHSGSPLYVTQEAGADLVELIYGQASEGLQAWWDQTNHTINLDNNHRFYVCDKVAGSPNNQWTDVTDTEQYGITNNTVQWLVDTNSKYTLVRSNQKHITQRMSILPVDGLMTFSLREFRDDVSGYRTMTLPLGELDIFLNGYPLLMDLDYFVDFPRIVINNKVFLEGNPDEDEQDIVFRFTSFCTDDLQMFDAPDIGFVQYGVLSFNNRFDIREDKVNRIVVGGALYRYDELKYAEGDFDIHVTDAKNGAPYAIRDILVPMNSYLYGESSKTDPTFALREKSRVIDKSISDYLTTKIPQKDPTEPSAISTMYPIVSPFFNKIIHDLKSGALWDDKFFEQYDDNWVKTQCARYEWLLPYDPVTEVRTLNPSFVVVHPHNQSSYVDLGIYQAKFLYRVEKIYGNNRIDLSAHIRVEQF